MLWLSRALVMFVVTLMAAQLVLAQSLVRVGGEFQVNSYTLDSQSVPAVATKGLGFVLVWASTRDGFAQGIFGQRYSSSGTQGGEFQINAHTDGAQYRPRVAADGPGNFVVVWESTGQDGDDLGIFGRRFDLTGTPLGGEFQVNSFTVGYQGGVAVAADADGDFVVVWTSDQQDGFYYGAFGRRFSSSGAPQGVEFQINSSTNEVEYANDVAFRSDGSFVVTWASSFNNASYRILARRYASGGAPLGGEFLVNTKTTSYQADSHLAVQADGDFVVAWAAGDGDAVGIFGRRFTSAGGAIGSEFQINAHTSGSQEDVAIAINAGGDFAVVWRGAEEGADTDVMARRLDASGLPLGGDVLVNTYTTENQLQPEVAAVGTDGFLVAWRSPQDGSIDGIFAQRLAVATLATLDVDGNSLLAPLADGLLVLRAHFGFSGATLITGAVGPNCTRCDSTAILTYINGLGLILDIDDDDTVQALTDGLLILRFLFGFTGTTLTSGAVDPDCGRCDAAAITPYLQTLD